MGRPPLQIPAGKRFGRLVVLGRAASASASRWLCRCDCGADHVASASHLVCGDTKSCGCLNRDATAQRSLKHGAARNRTETTEYRIWRNMLQRCREHPEYAGRGIGVCDAWMTSFATFLVDVGPRPSSEHSLDRYPDNNGNYEPGNVRWATRREQMRNTRDNVMVVVGVATMTLTEAAEKAGLTLSTVHQRLNKLGWPIDRALGLPSDVFAQIVGKRSARDPDPACGGGAA
jgi:hypothetical protein